jgi:hypothetical protein
MWITSSKVLPVIMLVVIPFSVTVIAPVISSFAPIVVSNIAGFPYWFSHIYLISISSLVYAFYPFKFRNIERRGLSNLLLEYACIKKILYFEVPILIAIISFFSLTSLVLYYDYDNYYSIQLTGYVKTIGKPIGEYNITLCCFREPPLQDISLSGGNILIIILNGLMINLGFSVTAGIIWMILVTVRKELGYYFAKLLFQTTIHEEEESKKAEYLIKATKLYDKYLRRTLNLEINNAKKIYSKILADPNLNKDESMRQISESFESNDKLEPIKSLSKVLNIKDTDTFLVDESIGKKIKDMAIFFATIIPVTVTVIQFLLQK